MDPLTLYLHEMESIFVTESNNTHKRHYCIVSFHSPDNNIISVL